jgi:hypothetical protein
MRDGGGAPADGDEGDVALVDTSEFGIVGVLAIEAQPMRTWPLRMPKFDEAEDLVGLIVAAEMGVCAA